MTCSTRVGLAETWRCLVPDCSLFGAPKKLKRSDLRSPAILGFTVFFLFSFKGSPGQNFGPLPQIVAQASWGVVFWLCQQFCLDGDITRYRKTVNQGEWKPGRKHEGEVQSRNLKQTLRGEPEREPKMMKL